jgi:hypothetical protein
MPQWELVLRPTRVSRLGLALVALPVGLGAAAAVPIAGVAVGAGYIASWALIGRRKIVLDDHGVRWKPATGRVVELAWTGVDHYTYWSGHVRGTGLLARDRRIDAPSNSVANTRHVLDLHGANQIIRIDSSWLDAERAAAMALGTLHPLLAERARFTPFAIADDGLHCDRVGVLPWSKLEVVKLDNLAPTRLLVMKVGKSFPWQSVSLARVHNGMLLLERLAERGVPIDLGHHQLFTETLLAAVDRGRALPRAEIVRRD